MGAYAQEKPVKSVDTNKFEEAVQADSVQLLDVRTAAEYAGGHIAYAKNIDVLQSDFKAKAMALLHKENLVYVYCRSGKRSMMAAKKLAAEGFRVVNLSGGFMAWTASGKAVNP